MKRVVIQSPDCNPPRRSNRLYSALCNPVPPFARLRLEPTKLYSALTKASPIDVATEYDARNDAVHFGTPERGVPTGRPRTCPLESVLDSAIFPSSYPRAASSCNRGAIRAVISHSAPLIRAAPALK